MLPTLLFIYLTIKDELIVPLVRAPVTQRKTHNATHFPVMQRYLFKLTRCARRERAFADLLLK